MSRKATVRSSNSVVLALSLALFACQPGETSEAAEVAKPGLGLFGTLPIYWGEGGDIVEMLSEPAAPDWVRVALEENFTLSPLDALEPETLAGSERLVLAQPRPLAPSENLALDTWLRDGGKALVFADPMLTRESKYPVGDRRRPQDVVLLSPILTRWGLELVYDDRQPGEERVVEDGALRIPVMLAGRFTLRPGEKAAECRLSGEGLIARCQVGKGSVTLVADAAVLDASASDEAHEMHRAALDALVRESLAD